MMQRKEKSGNTAGDKSKILPEYPSDLSPIVKQSVAVEV